MPAPGAALALAARDPSGVPASDRTPGRDSWGVPLMGFDPPSRLHPKSPPCASRRPAPLVGFRAPTTLAVSLVHGPSSLRALAGASLLWAPRSFPRESAGGPTRRLRCRSQVFPTSQRPSSVRDPPTIFRWVAFWGFHPSGVCSSLAGSTTRRRRHALVTLLPPVCTCSIPRWSHHGRIDRCLGLPGPMPFVVFRAFVCE